MELFSQLPPDAPTDSFRRLCYIMERLLAPDGCPWDREQTHHSLRQYLIEEAYEVYDAIEDENWEHLREELGDVGLQVVFHSMLARQDGRFDVDDVYDSISEKLIRRHPHVFADTPAENAEEVLINWEQIKKRERHSGKKDESLLAGVPRALPALQKAHRMQGKARRVGFDWPSVHCALEKVHEEFNELAQAFSHTETEAPREKLFEEFGDLLFAMTNVARMLDLQPEEALQAACAKFEKRFRHIERRAAETGRDLESMSLEEMDEFWEESKCRENNAAIESE